MLTACGFQAGDAAPELSQECPTSTAQSSIFRTRSAPWRSPVVRSTATILIFSSSRRRAAPKSNPFSAPRSCRLARPASCRAPKLPHARYDFDDVRRAPPRGRQRAPSLSLCRTSWPCPEPDWHPLTGRARTSLRPLPPHAVPWLHGGRFEREPSCGDGRRAPVRAVGG